jgi:hypothetical protein
MILLARFDRSDFFEVSLCSVGSRSMAGADMFFFLIVSNTEMIWSDAQTAATVRMKHEA